MRQRRDRSSEPPDERTQLQDVMAVVVGVQVLVGSAGAESGLPQDEGADGEAEHRQDGPHPQRCVEHTWDHLLRHDPVEDGHHQTRDQTHQCARQYDLT